MIEEEHLWYPYAQMKTMKEPYEVESAKGIYINTSEGKSLIDGVSSWWCAVHGYNNDEMNEAIIEQMKKFSHIMLGGLTHKPAKLLADKLVEITPEGLNHVFFSDSGSVGVEVALKMAIQYFSNKGNSRKTKFVSLENSYHGDTFKAMEIGDDEDFHGAFINIFRDVVHAPAPRPGYDLPEYQVREDIDKLEDIFREHHEELAAFIVEPLIQAAGGFNFYSPKYLNEARKLCDKYDILFIFDEVATGFGRTGKLFAMSHTEIVPDIVVLGKALTGGYTGHAATITKTRVFESFYGNTYEEAFMHGPTFMGNALACSAALKSLEIFHREKYLEKINKIQKILKDELASIDSEEIKSIRTFGVTGVIEVNDGEYLKGFQEFAYSRGVWLRPFGNYLYTMPAYIISENDLKKVISVMKEWFLK